MYLKNKLIFSSSKEDSYLQAASFLSFTTRGHEIWKHRQILLTTVYCCYTIISDMFSVLSIISNA